MLTVLAPGQEEAGNLALSRAGDVLQDFQEVALIAAVTLEKGLSQQNRSAPNDIKNPDYYFLATSLVSSLGIRIQYKFIIKEFIVKRYLQQLVHSLFALGIHNSS